MGRKPIEKTEQEKRQAAIDQQQYIDNWCKDNATRISLKLMNRSDADILEHLIKCESKQGEIKRILRLAMETEKNK